MKNEQGQSIIEVVVAIAIVALVLVALVSAVTVAIRNATFSKNKSVATKYVNEGMEAVRSIRDNSWTDLTDAHGTFNGLQFSAGAWSFSGTQDYPDSPTNQFTRVIEVTCNPPTNDSCDIDVQVSWTSGGSSYSSSASTTFTKWSAY